MTRKDRDAPQVVPKAAAARLALYLRCLEKLKSGGMETISSQQLATAVGVTAAQVRKDLGYFGQFGFPGVGYRIDHLIAEIRRILGTDRTWKVALVGVGKLGSALLDYRGFTEQGFRICALFDRQPEVIGRVLGDLVVDSIDDIGRVVAEKEIELCILAVPAEAAQAVADQVVAAGIRGIFNFAPVVLNLPEKVGYVSIDLAVQLEQLSFYVTQAERPFEEASEGATDTASGLPEEPDS